MERGRDVNKIKTTAKIAGFLLVVLLALGCGGRTPGSSSGLNPPTLSSSPSASHATSKFLYVVNSIEKTVQGFAIDAATGALSAAGTAAAADDEIGRASCRERV